MRYWRRKQCVCGGGGGGGGGEGVKEGENAPLSLHPKISLSVELAMLGEGGGGEKGEGRGERHWNWNRIEAETCDMKSVSDRTSRGPLEVEHNVGLLLSVCVRVCVRACVRSIYKSISILASIFCMYIKHTAWKKKRKDACKIHYMAQWSVTTIVSNHWERLLAHLKTSVEAVLYWQQLHHNAPLLRHKSVLMIIH